MSSDMWIVLFPVTSSAATGLRFSGTLSIDTIARNASNGSMSLLFGPFLIRQYITLEVSRLNH